MVRDPELVAEVVQQTFVKAWPGVAGFDDARPLAPWLYAIARRTAVDVLRREGRHQDVVSLDDGPQERPEASVEPVTFEKTWEVFEVRQALDDLPADEREVVRLSHLVGMTHVEIADRLGGAGRNGEVALGSGSPSVGRRAGPSAPGREPKPILRRTGGKGDSWLTIYQTATTPLSRIPTSPRCSRRPRCGRNPTRATRT